VLRALGSLWFAAVLLVLLLVAMACATVFESAHGTEQARVVFYQSRWFEWLLAMLAINVLAAVLLRYPFAKRQVGFVVTHLSILVIMGGALVTKHYGIDGQVGLLEGETVKHFRIRQDSLTATKLGLHSSRSGNSEMARRSIDLSPSVSGGFRAVDVTGSPILRMDDLHIKVARYLPDSVAVRHVVNDHPDLQPAIEVSLSASGRDDPTWVFSDHTAEAPSATVLFRLITSDEELKRLVAATPATQPVSQGVVKAEHKGSSFEFPLEMCTDQAQPIDQTGYTIRVLRYWPHAIVGPDNELESASDRPINPAIEVELDGPTGKVKRLAFARFPEFWSMHQRKQDNEIKVTFVTPAFDIPSVPIEVLSGPDGDMYVRFNTGRTEVVTEKLELGVPTASPWPNLVFTVLRRFDHAHVERVVEPVEPVRADRVPALSITLNTAHESREIWARKNVPERLQLDDNVYEITYEDKVVSLGFDLTLDRFEIGHYPGTKRPRSFESHVTVLEPVTGRKQSRVISMNHPARFGGYTLYQSSYRQDGDRTASYLSVSWDPGQPIVFAGYIGVTMGMAWVLGVRMVNRRRRG